MEGTDEEKQVTGEAQEYDEGAPLPEEDGGVPQQEGEEPAAPTQETEQGSYIQVDPLEQLRHEAVRKNQDHMASRSEIDDLLRRLLVTESQLEEVLGGEADASALLICRRFAQAKAREVQEENLESSRKEKEKLDEELRRKGQEEQELEAQLREEEEREATMGPRSTMLECQNTLKLLNELEERERELRELERKEVHKDNILEEGREVHSRLEKENDEVRFILEDMLKQAEATKDMLAQEKAEHLSELEHVETLLHDQARKTQGLRNTRSAQQTYYAQLRQVHDALEQDVRSSRQGLEEAQLDLSLREREARRDEEKQLARLEEVMMLLKAAAVNLGDDHQFIGLVCQKVIEADEGETRGLDAFTQAFAFIRRYVEEALGPQIEGERWKPCEGGDADWGVVPYGAVEVLLSALKQLVVCFDMMHEEGKREVGFVHELVQNSGHLQGLIQETVFKYKEIEHAREADAARALEEEQEKKRKQEAKKYAPRSNYDPYSRKAPSLRGPRPSQLPVRGVGTAGPPASPPKTQEP